MLKQLALAPALEVFGLRIVLPKGEVEEGVPGASINLVQYIKFYKFLQVFFTPSQAKKLIIKSRNFY